MKMVEYEKAELTEEIQHWKCSSCNKPVTFVTDTDTAGWAEIQHHHFFVIRRSQHDFQVLSTGELETECDEENIKMEKILCRSCMDSIITESSTLQKLFQDKDNRVIY